MVLELMSEESFNSNFRAPELTGKSLQEKCYISPTVMGRNQAGDECGSKGACGNPIISTAIVSTDLVYDAPSDLSEDEV